ncbi:MAG: hypothetical protein ACI8X5_000377 [Planctomycetota bacterium]
MSAKGRTFGGVLERRLLLLATVGVVLSLSPNLVGRPSWVPVHTTALKRAERPVSLPVPEGDFENWDPENSPWEMQGEFLSGPTNHQSDGYYGRGFAQFGAAPGSLLTQTIPLFSSAESALPRGSEMEAGVWLRFDPRTEIYDGAHAPSVDLRIFSVGRGEPRLLAHAHWSPAASEIGAWNYLETEVVSRLHESDRALRIEIYKGGGGVLAADFVQLGERHSIDGNPIRRVGANYVGRYRSPKFPLAGTSPDTPQEIWRNWCWMTPPACNSDFSGFFHNPDCATNPSCLRPNGRRDLAISTLNSGQDLPLIGSYDSRDKDVIRYHIALAENAGIDHFIYDYQGYRLASQVAQQGREAINYETWEALLDVVEEPGSDFKLAVMYEPKVHMLGWVAGEPTKTDKVLGIAGDLVHLANQMRGRRASLRHDGRLVVFLFRNKLCNGAGNQCLLESDWTFIHQFVKQQTGEDLFLVGDSPPAGNSALQGLTRWQLVSRDYLRYRNYVDAQLDRPTMPSAQLSSLVQHAGDLASGVMDWQAQGPKERVAIQTVWPGFDDTGVGGWGVANLTGEDGNPLCVRVTDDFDGVFYASTVEAAFESGADWIQIATFNDWNEMTSIEPAYHLNYVSPMLIGGLPAAEITDHIFGRLKETRQWIQSFKGEDFPTKPFHAIANTYMRFAQRTPGVPVYD